MKKNMLFMTITIVIMSLVAGCSGCGEDITALAVINVSDENENTAVESEDDVELDTATDDNAQENGEPSDAGSVAHFPASSNDPAFDEFIDILYVNPENYLDKTITVSGQYMGYFSEYANRYTHYIYKWDEMGCCPLMMEFMLRDDFSPDDFPEEDSEIEIAGVYSSYEEEDFDWTNYYVAVEILTVLDGGNPQ